MATKEISDKDIKKFKQIERKILSKSYDQQTLEKDIVSFMDSKKELEKNHLYYYYAGSYLLDIGSFVKASEYFTKCTELAPNFPDVYYTVGLSHFNNKNYNFAFDCASQAYKLGFRNHLIHGIVGACLAFKTGAENMKAISFLEEQKKLFPGNFSSFQHVYALALRSTGEAEKASAELLDLIEKEKPSNRVIYSDLIMTLMHSSEFNDKALLDIALACDKNALQVNKINFDHNRRLDVEIPRVGVIFPYTKNSIAHWLLELFKKRNKKFFYAAYHNSANNDEDTEDIKNNVDLFRDVYGMSDEEAAKVIYDDEIDVLFDIRTHVRGDRLDIIKQKPSPVQVNWLDSIPPTGSPEMDYTITDNYIIPEESEKFFTEKLYRLPSSYFYYKEPDYDIKVEEPPCIKNGYVTFASFHRSSKVNIPLLRVWAKILKQVEGSKLLIKNSLMHEAAYREKLAQPFIEAGIEPDRIIFELQDKMEPFLKKCNEIDICLDSFPLNGASTILRTFWMAKPTVILLGDTRFGRISYSIVKNLGLDELIAHNEEEYIKLSVELANSPERLTEYTKTLRDKLINSDMCNAAKFQGQLEDAIMYMWNEYKKSKSE